MTAHLAEHNRPSGIRPLIPFRVGLFLAVRQLWRYGRGTTALTVFIMTLTFLNLVVVSGVLVGLIEGSRTANRLHYSGDLLITPLKDQTDIGRTSDLSKALGSLPQVQAFSVRLAAPGIIEANYRTSQSVGRKPDSRGAEIVGIDPVAEDRVTSLARHVVEGRYLDPDAFGEVLVGASLLNDYARADIPGETLLKDVHTGTKIRLTVGGNTLEVTVRGVVKAKVGQIDQRVFMAERDLRKLTGRLDVNASEIAAILRPGVAPETVQAALVGRGFGSDGLIQTWTEAQGSFFRDLENTFRTLGNFIGSIALAVAALTVFILVFINALTRKRYIGIMKGFGISGSSISAAYVFQSLFYSICGVGLGLLLLYGLIKPYFDLHPIDFPFSDGILSVPPLGVAIRVAAMFMTAITAGYVPAQLIIRKNTLDTILGR